MTVWDLHLHLCKARSLLFTTSMSTIELTLYNQGNILSKSIKFYFEGGIMEIEGVTCMSNSTGNRSVRD